MDKIDNTDIEILKILTLNSRTPIKHISKKVCLSEPSVKARIDKMIDNKTIQSFTIKTNYQELGLPISFFVTISDLKLQHHSFVKKLSEFANITEIYSLTGSSNFLIKGYAFSILSLESFLSTLMDYGKVTTSIILEDICMEPLITKLDNDHYELG